MPVCCPPGHGCNATGPREPCVLELCRRAAGQDPAAAETLERWERWQAARRGGESRAERRFRRRAYERARDRALAGLLMRAEAAARRHQPARVRPAYGGAELRRR